MLKRKLLFSYLCVFGVLAVLAQGITTPKPSPLATVKQEIGLSEVEVTYSRPSVKGRVIFGELVPYGKIWRTGANAATKISFSDEVMVSGQKVPAGEYALYTIPNKDKWTIIIHKNTTHWGEYGYDEKEDLMRFDVQPKSLNDQVETMTIQFANIKSNKGDFELLWDKTKVSFTVSNEVDSKVMAEIKEKMEKPEAGLATMYFQSARYYFDTDRDLDQALEWANKGIDVNPDAFWISRLKSQIQAKLKDYKGAIKTAELSKEKAEKAGNQQYVKFNEMAIAEWSDKL